MAEDLWKKHCALIQSLCFMDDIFFSTCFDGNIECVQYILRIILDKEDLIVKEVHSQQSVELFYGRSVRLDLFAEDSTGKLYNIEIQRSDDGAIPQRARFNSSMLDVHNFNKGEHFKNLPEAFVIFITEHDVLKGNKQIYHIERTIKELGKNFEDGSKIIYVNGSIRSGSILGDLMHDFFCKDTAKMKHKTLADCAAFFKSPDKGGVIMSSVAEKLINEGKIEGKIEAIRSLMESLHVTAEEAMNLLKISPEQQKGFSLLI